MKIWVIGRGHPAEGNSMSGSFELAQSKMLAKGGHDVTYIAISFHPFRRIRNWGYATWHEDQITVCSYSIPCIPSRFKIELQWFKECIYKRVLLRILYQQGTPDVIHVHYPARLAGDEAVFSLQNQGVVIVCTEHWSRVLTNQMSRHERRRLQKYADNADAFICVGAPLKNAVAALTGRKNIQLVPNVVEKCFVPRSEERNGVKKFISVGRLVTDKQFDKIIDAFSKLYMKHKNTELIIVGGGREYKALEKRIHCLHMGEAVHLIGPQPREKVAELVAESDCLLLYSKFETFGVPIIEAWACGIPVIVSDCFGFSEYWNDGLGYIVDHNNLDELVEKMETVIMEYVKYNHQNIAQYAQEHFGEEAVLKRLEIIYKKCKN